MYSKSTEYKFFQNKTNPQLPNDIINMNKIVSYLTAIINMKKNLNYLMAIIHNEEQKSGNPPIFVHTQFKHIMTCLQRYDNNTVLCFSYSIILIYHNK